MDAHQLVLMLHTSGNGMGEVANQQFVRRVLERFPGIKIVLGHMGRYLEADEFFRFADSGLLEFPNLYLEMSSATIPAVYARALQHRTIYRRLLFGTDLPFGLITGMEAWSDRAGAIFVTRDTYPWTDEAVQQASPVRPDQLTYNTYHVLHAFKTELDSLGLPPCEEAALKQAVFRTNAESLFAASIRFPRPNWVPI
jgi:predicted TIM-barrel fold metal-dependent hydrolase